MGAAKMTQPKKNTKHVFTWPITWNDTALNRPMHRNDEMFTSTAKKHETARKVSDAELHS